MQAIITNDDQRHERFRQVSQCHKLALGIIASRPGAGSVLESASWQSATHCPFETDNQSDAVAVPELSVLIGCRGPRTGLAQGNLSLCRPPRFLDFMPTGSTTSLKAGIINPHSPARALVS